MSANLVVDLVNTCQIGASLPGVITITPSGLVAGLSGVAVGDIIDMLNSNTYTNVLVLGRSVSSGPLRVGVQTSDTTTSGSFTDPTSGLVQLPTNFSSGGWLVIGQSGVAPGLLNAGEGVSGQYLLSGFATGGAFQRPHRYARLILGSGFYDGEIQAALIGNLHTTGSGGGYSYSPSSGVVNV